MMPPDLFVQFIDELATQSLPCRRSLIEAAFATGLAAAFGAAQGRRGVHRAVFVVHRRNRERLFNKLLTEIRRGM